MAVRENDLVLLVSLDDGVRLVARVTRGARISTIRGFINADELIGVGYGSIVRTSLGHEVAILRPSPVDILMERGERVTQVIYPKDAAQIIMSTGIGPGTIVAEAGVGSGFMTAFLAYYVRPNGKVYGFDKRRENLEVARRNLSMLGLLDYVELELRDVITEGFNINNTDVVLLDLGDPWNAIPNATQALKPSGYLVVYVPTINQVLKVLDKMRELKYADIKMMDVTVREWKTKTNEVRPNTWINAHTGYVIIGRKTIR
ncbi:tRNA (adenine-N1)-methyltransferase [Vulcanisaeta thermophila]|uniref:tRNA (adenine-N1)-methyltransferase n=1 Tax=Vulcanisaeta thermophila TaxID=867917 RepID=UPI000853DDE9|nr:tRNA (adenine-N1)-methyltransferase [Vulcanisaeta thermophila]